MAMLEFAYSFVCVPRTCAHDLRVIGKGSYEIHGSFLYSGHFERHSAASDLEGTRRQFFDSYKNDAQMRSVDGFLCFHSAALCEIFMPFNKTIMVISTTRYALSFFCSMRLG